MEKRYFDSIGREISLLGFGCMRLPLAQPDQPEIDLPAAQALIDLAMAQGVNYYDTAYMYHEGLSEPFLGQALKRYPRESFCLASKMPTWTKLVRDAADVEKIFAEQLKRCQVDYFDFYLLHSLDAENFANAEKIGIYQLLKEKQRQGHIRRLGFSFHDTPEVLTQIVDAHDWDFAQIQLNYLDWKDLESERLYRILTERHLPVIIMEPVRGGALATLNESCTAMLQKAAANRSTASWAIRFAASLPGVMTVLSGMSDQEQVADNLNTMSAFQPLTDAEQQMLIEQVAGAYRSAGEVPCTGCRYCMDCPVGVNIPKVFLLYNRYKANQKEDSFQEDYGGLPVTARAEQCIACGQCAAQCPQKIDIPAQMEHIRQVTAGLGL